MLQHKGKQFVFRMCGVLAALFLDDLPEGKVSLNESLETNLIK